MRGGAPRNVALATAFLLAGCSFVTLTDPYGNRYGDLYNPGANYRWQMLACEQAIDDQAVPNARRKDFLRCCMGAHGVPIADLAACPATG